QSGKKVHTYTTAKDTDLKLSETETPAFENMPQPLETQICVFVDPEKTFQTYTGIGAALTDAAAETFAKLPDLKQKEFLEAHFDATKGLGYTIARTNINSCDFSSDMYTYVQDNDKTLSSFDIAHDRKYKIPLIKQAMAASNGKLKLFGSPWSPPAWMKSNNDMLQGGKLLPEYYSIWAKYFTKFIKSYEKEGVPVWGMTIQNEPMAKQRWESCIFTAEEERDFLKFHLGPELRKAGLGSRKIIVWDHNRDLIYQRAQTYLSDPETAKFIWGVGFHWYEDWSGGQAMYDNLRRVYEAFPDTKIFFTEGCTESFNATRYNAWELGEEYGRSMINDFNNGMVGFTDWNILLDETGGPNHVGNFCFAPVHANTQTGELIYTNSYYYIGHFSKFIQSGARRIISSPSRSQLLSTAFLNPDGTIVVVVMNQSEKSTPYFIWIKGKAVELNILPRAIQTIVF
ncbi:MAG: glycoside hydrolase family 30 protein, partial [Saprospiraceae bacterium]